MALIKVITSLSSSLILYVSSNRPSVQSYSPPPPCTVVNGYCHLLFQNITKLANAGMCAYSHFLTHRKTLYKCELCSAAAVCVEVRRLGECERAWSVGTCRARAAVHVQSTLLWLRGLGPMDAFNS